MSVLMLGAAVMFSSCATRNDVQTTGPAVQYEPATTVADTPLPPPPDNADPWPMTFTADGNDYTVFEPQCDSWDGHQLVARSAVAVQAPGQAQPVYGVVAFNAITLVDKASHQAKLVDFKLSSADFPSARDQTQNYLLPVVIHFAKDAPPLPLDHLQSSLVLVNSPQPEQLNNTPPKIIMVTHPALLVSIDGPPAWRPVAGTGLQRVINTRALLLKDQSNQYYLHLFDGYLQAASLDGPWQVAAQPPAGADAAVKQVLASGAADLMTGSPDQATNKPPSLRSSPVPAVYIATQPSELIVLDGQPNYSAIPGTRLLYASNTSANLFKLLTDQQNYLLISGRWYAAPTLRGPWKFVPGNDLPRDFADIPNDSPKENVKASVPGTVQAEEALIANSIPESTAVSRSAPLSAPFVDGSPQLTPINGTPLHYVANSETPIIEVDPQSWYACQNGVWYVAGAVDGPWSVAPSVPSVIYTIPPDSPLHYLTYVQVYDSTPDLVYEGYTPGYLGTEVCDDGTVVYGTGYDYPPWIGSVWLGPPMTWGYGFDDFWTPWWGWGYGCGFGWGFCYPPSPWWCGYRGWYGHGGYAWRDGGRGGWANTAVNVYGHHHDAAAWGHVNGSFNYSRANGFGHAYNSRTGQLAAGQQARVQNVSGGAWDPSRSGSSHAFFGQSGFNNARGWPAGFHNSVTSSSPGNFARSWAWSGSRQPAFNGVAQNHFFYLPRSSEPFRNAQGLPSQSWRTGNNFGFSRGGGWASHIGGLFHGGGGSHSFGGFHGGGGGGGGFHGGGGGGFHGGGGGGGRGR